MRGLILRALALLDLGAKAPPIIDILTSIYNPQMLYNHAMLYKGWHEIFESGGDSHAPPGFSELVRRVSVQRALTRGEK